MGSRSTWRLILNILWCSTTILLIIGLTRPMFTFTHFYFFDDTFSLVDGVFHLATQGEYILFSLLFIFSLLMPTLKMLMLFYTINAASVFSYVQQRRLDKLAKIGKWSMLDVYVIAILAVTVKLGMIASVTIHYGLIAFALSVSMSMILPWLISYAYLRAPFRRNAEPIQWSWYDMKHQAMILDTLSINELITQTQLTITLDNASQARLIDIFDTEQQWQAKVSLSQEEQRGILTLIAHR